MPMEEFIMLIIRTCVHNGRGQRLPLHKMSLHRRWPGIERECIISTPYVVLLLREEEATIIHHPEVETVAADKPLLHLYPRPQPHPPLHHYCQTHVTYQEACHNFQILMIHYLQAGKKDYLELAESFLLITTHGQLHGHILPRGGIRQAFHRYTPQLPIPTIAVDQPHYMASVSQLATYSAQAQNLILYKQMEPLVLYQMAGRCALTKMGEHSLLITTHTQHSGKTPE